MRARHVLTNTGAAPYVLDGLELTIPVPQRCSELLDFTGRHEHERTPQRHEMTDGLYLREVRRGRTSLESPSLLVAGTPGFGFSHGDVVGVHVAFSGNSVLRAERLPSAGLTIGGGELLLPGEIVLQQGDSYEMPWLVIMAGEGLDELAAEVHAWQRTLAAHPGEQPVILNVWEAVYFDHDLAKLTGLAELAARVGVERFVLDDGWFGGRRNARAGLGDWWVSDEVWPDGLTPLVDRVHELGMQFGLWFEPEMVNPDSDLYREHPDWILQAGGRVPILQRNQLVLDLSRDEVRTYLRDRISQVLVRARDRLRQVGSQPRPARSRQQRARRRPGRPRANARLLPAARRTACGTPERRMGIVRVRWRTDRPRRARARAAGLDLGHDRCPCAPAHSALDGAARRPGVPRRARVRADLAPERAHVQPRLPGCDRAVRLVRHRVEPHRGERGRPRQARPNGCSGTRRTGRLLHVRTDRAHRPGR